MVCSYAGMVINPSVGIRELYLSHVSSVINLNCIPLIFQDSLIKFCALNCLHTPDNFHLDIFASTLSAVGN